MVPNFRDVTSLNDGSLKVAQKVIKKFMAILQEK